MRAFQFWTLLLCSVFISLLYIRQIFLSRDLNHQQRNLVESQQVISESTEYENAWKQLALHIYQSGHGDPALVGILKTENVDVHPAGTPKAAPGTLPTTTPVMPSAPVKSPAPPAQPGTP